MNQIEARSHLQQIAQRNKWSNPDRTKRSCLRMAIDSNPGIAREAGLTTPETTASFINEACSLTATVANTTAKNREQFTQWIEGERKRLGVNFDYNRSFSQFYNSGSAMDGTGVKPISFGQGQQSNPAIRTPVNPGGPSNDGPGDVAAPSVWTTRHAALLGLNRVDPAELKAAWYANGKAFNPVDVKKVYDSVIAHHAETAGITTKTATARVRELHPNLARKVDDLSSAN